MENFNKLIDIESIGYKQIYKTINLIYYLSRDGRISGSPLSRVGDAEFQYNTDEDLKIIIKEAELFCKYSIKNILNKMNEINNKNSNLIYLPSLKNAVFINSKIEYLKILKDIIDKSTLLVEAPLEINIDKVIEYKNNYVEGNLVYPLEKLCVIKTPFAGGSSCVVNIPNLEANKNKPYEYWLGIFIKKSQHKKIKCSGFSIGLIIQNYNDFFSEIGEFRCFCVNGIIVAIIYSFNDEFHLIAHREELFNKNDDLKIENLGELNIYQNGINNIQKNIKNHYNNANNNANHKINFFNNSKNYLEKFEEICNYVKDKFESCGQPLNINRIDLVISSDSTLTNPNFIVNEVEDFSCGPASTYPVNKLINNNNIDIMFKFKQILAKLYFNSLKQ